MAKFIRSPQIPSEAAQFSNRALAACKRDLNESSLYVLVGTAHIILVDVARLALDPGWVAYANAAP